MMVDELQTAMREYAASDLVLIDRRTAGARDISQQNLTQTLARHDRLVQHSTFSTESFDCGICLDTKKGARCTRLRNCGHVFCVECLYSYFELNIREGMVQNVSCADTECVKRARKAGQESCGLVESDELEDIVGKELKDRYIWLLEKQRIESGKCMLHEEGTGRVLNTFLLQILP